MTSNSETEKVACILIHGQLVSQSRLGAMYVSAAQLFSTDGLASRHLDQRRPTQKDLCLIDDKDSMV